MSDKLPLPLDRLRVLLFARQLIDLVADCDTATVDERVADAIIAFIRATERTTS